MTSTFREIRLSAEVLQSIAEYLPAGLNKNKKMVMSSWMSNVLWCICSFCEISETSYNVLGYTCYAYLSTTKQENIDDMTKIGIRWFCWCSGTTWNAFSHEITITTSDFFPEWESMFIQFLWEETIRIMWDVCHKYRRKRMQKKAVRFAFAFLCVSCSGGCGGCLWVRSGAFSLKENCIQKALPCSILARFSFNC